MYKLKKKNLYFFFLTLLVLGFIAYFIFTIAYYRFPLGDDVLHQFTTSYLLYSSTDQPSLGTQVTNWQTLAESVYLKYLYHSGRAIGYSLLPLLSIFGHFFTALLAVVIFIGVVLLVVKNIYFEDNPLLHPFSILLCFLILFYFHPGIGWLLMWTFTSIYVVSLLLLLSFITVLRKVLEKDKEHKLVYYVLLNVLGLIAGLTQEVFSLAFLFIAFSLILIAVLKNKKSYKLFLYLIGLGVGFILCLAAPGNFYRLAQSHDAIPLVVPILIRLKESILTHRLSIMGYYFSSVVLLPFLLLYCIQFLQRIKLRSAPMFEDVLFVTAMLTVLAWSVFPYTPMYGTQAFIVFLTVAFLIAFKKSHLLAKFYYIKWIKYFYGGLVLAAIGTLLVINVPWMKLLRNNSLVWQKEINQAITENKQEVYVPRFPDLTSNRFTMKNYNNRPEYETEYYQKFYKIKIIVY